MAKQAKLQGKKGQIILVWNMVTERFDFVSFEPSLEKAEQSAEEKAAGDPSEHNVYFVVPATAFSAGDC